jgi:hypothetical protein
MMTTPIYPDPIEVQDLEIIDAYLRDELSSEEKQQVDERRRIDATFDVLFRAQVKLTAAARIDHLNQKLRMLRAHASTRQARVVPMKRRMFLYAGVAGVLLLLMTAGIVFLIPAKHDRIFSSVFSNTILPGKAELSTTEDPLVTEAFGYYAREQYGRAARVFDKLSAAHPGSDYLLYAAASHLGAGNIARAEALLAECKSLFPSNAPDIVLLQALALVRKGDLAGARAHLDTHAHLIPESRHLQDLRDKL